MPHRLQQEILFYSVNIKLLTDKYTTMTMKTEDKLDSRFSRAGFLGDNTLLFLLLS